MSDESKVEYQEFTVIFRFGDDGSFSFHIPGVANTPEMRETAAFAMKEARRALLSVDRPVLH